MTIRSRLYQLEKALLAMPSRFEPGDVLDEGLHVQLMLEVVRDGSVPACIDIATKHMTEEQLEELYEMREPMRALINRTLEPGEKPIEHRSIMSLDMFYHNMKMTYRFLKGELPDQPGVVQ